MSAKILGKLPSPRRCSFCGAALRVPARFNGLLFCPVRQLRATHPAARYAPKYSTRDGHTLCVIPGEHVAPPRSGLLARAAAAVRSAVAVFKSKP